MPEIPRTRLLAYVLAAVLVVAVGVWSLRREAAGAAGTPAAVSLTGPGGAAGAFARTTGDDGGRASSRDDVSPDGVGVESPPAAAPVVHVAGAVRRTGVYRLPDGARVQDAVRRAGGATSEANLDGINLAAKVADGQQIVVPSATPSAAAGGPAPTGDAADVASAAPVGLNAATLDELQTLDGVGPATAEKIVAWRTEHGGFRSVDDLGQVPGIGPKRLAALREHVQP